MVGWFGRRGAMDRRVALLLAMTGVWRRLAFLTRHWERLEVARQSMVGRLRRRGANGSPRRFAPRDDGGVSGWISSLVIASDRRVRGNPR